MSIPARDYVWQCCHLKGSKKLALLALAEFADDAGVAKPGVDRIADYIGLEVRATQVVLHQLEASGYITIEVGKGLKTKSGWTNKYTIKGVQSTTPLQPEEMQAITPLDDEAVQQLTPLETEGVQKNTVRGAKSSTQGVQSFAPKPSDKNRQVNRQERSAPAAPDATPPRSPETRVQHQAILDAYTAALGYPLKNGGKEANAAAWLAKHGYVPEQTVACYRDLKRDPFWEEKHLSLQTVASQIGAWTKKHNGRAPPSAAQPKDTEALRAQVAAGASDPDRQARIAARLAEFNGRGRDERD